MENRINVAELLKDCPKGMELYSTIYGTVYFEGVRDTGYAVLIDIKTSGNTEVQFYSDGKFNTYYSDSEITLFPSKDVRTWEGFQRPFKDGDILSYQYKGFKNRTIYIYMHHNKMNTTYYVALSGNSDSEFMINYKEGHALNSYNDTVRFATEEEKQKLFDAIKANGYRWNAETKTLEKLIKPNKEEVMKEKLEQITLDIPNGYKFFGINNDNKVVLTKKQPQYPQTFVEVLNFWHPDRQLEDDYQRCYKKDLIEKFQDLLYARDAYWKIAGEQMGLGKPWGPDWTKADKRKYCIVNTEGNIVKWVQKTTNKIIAFPTEEMRDVFYDNFKELIESCKELL